MLPSLVKSILVWASETFKSVQWLGYLLYFKVTQNW
jgi:hypothetical protein